MDDDDIIMMLSEGEMLQLASELSLQDTWHNSLITEDDCIEPQDGDLQLPSSIESVDTMSPSNNPESIFSKYVSSYETTSNTPSGSIYGENYTNDSSYGSGSLVDESSLKADAKDSKPVKDKSKKSTFATGSSSSNAGGTHKSKIFSKKKIIRSVTETVNSLTKQIDKHFDWFHRKYIRDDHSGADFDESDANGDYDAAVAASLQQQDLLAQQQYLNQMQAEANDEQLVLKLLYSIRRKDRVETYHAASLLLSLCSGCDAALVIQELQQQSAISILLSAIKRASEWQEVEMQLTVLVAVLIPHERETSQILKHASEILIALHTLLVTKVAISHGSGVSGAGADGSVTPGGDLQSMLDDINNNSNPELSQRRNASAEDMSLLSSGRSRNNSVAGSTANQINGGNNKRSSRRLLNIDASSDHDGINDKIGRDNVRCTMSLAITNMCDILCTEWRKLLGSGFDGANTIGQVSDGLSTLHVPVDDIDMLMTTNASVLGDDSMTHADLNGGGNAAKGCVSSAANAEMINNLGLLMRIIDLISSSAGVTTSTMPQQKAKSSPKPERKLTRIYSLTKNSTTALSNVLHAGPFAFSDSTNAAPTSPADPVLSAEEQASLVATVIENAQIDAATVTCSAAVAEIALVTACRECFVLSGALKLLMCWLNRCTNCLCELYKCNVVKLSGSVYVPLIELLTNTCSVVLSLTTQLDLPFGYNIANNVCSIGWTDAQVLGVGIPSELVRLLLITQGISPVLSSVDVPEVQHLIKLCKNLVHPGGGVGDLSQLNSFPAFPQVCTLQLAESLSNLASRQYNRSRMISCHVPLVLYVLFIDSVHASARSLCEASAHAYKQGAFSKEKHGSQYVNPNVEDEYDIARMATFCVNGLRCFLESQYTVLIDLLCADEFLTCIYFLLNNLRGSTSSLHINSKFKFPVSPAESGCRLAILRLLSMLTEWGDAIDSLTAFHPSKVKSESSAWFPFHFENGDSPAGDVFIGYLLGLAKGHLDKGQPLPKPKNRRFHSSNSSSLSGHSMSALAVGFGSVIDDVVRSSEQAIRGFTSGFGFNSPSSTYYDSPHAGGPTAHECGSMNGSAISNSGSGLNSVPNRPPVVERDHSNGSAFGPHMSMDDTICSTNLVVSVQVAELIALSVILANIASYNDSNAVKCYQLGLLQISFALIKKRNDLIKRQAIKCIKALCPIIMKTPIHVNPTTWEVPHRMVGVSHVCEEFALLALKALLKAMDFNSNSIQRDALLGIIYLAKSDDKYERTICDSIAYGPFKSFARIFLDPYSDPDTRSLTEEILKTLGFSGLADFELCRYDYQLLLDWYKLKRLCTIQQLVFQNDLNHWINGELFNTLNGADTDWGRMGFGGPSFAIKRPSTNSIDVNRSSSNAKIKAAGGSTFTPTLYEHSPLNAVRSNSRQRPQSFGNMKPILQRTITESMMKLLPNVLCFGNGDGHRNHRSLSYNRNGYSQGNHRSGHHHSGSNAAPNGHENKTPVKQRDVSILSDGGIYLHSSSDNVSNEVVPSMTMDRNTDGDSDDNYENELFGATDNPSGRDSLGSNIGANIGKVVTAFIGDSPSGGDGNTSLKRGSSSSVDSISGNHAHGIDGAAYDGIVYSPYVENVMPYDGKDMIPSTVQELLETFYPSKLQHIILTGLIDLGLEIMTIDPTNADKNSIVYETSYKIPTGKSTMAILFPSRSYMSFKRVGKIIEKTLSDHLQQQNLPEEESELVTKNLSCDFKNTTEFSIENQSGQSEYVEEEAKEEASESLSDECSWSLTFRNSNFEGEFHISFLHTLRNCPQITAVNFVCLEVSNDTRLGWLAGHFPNSVQYISFENALSSDAIEALCVLLKQSNAAFKVTNSNSGSLKGYGGDGVVHSFIEPKDRKGLQGLSITRTNLVLKDIETIIDLITSRSTRTANVIDSGVLYNASSGGTGSGEGGKFNSYSIPFHIRKNLLPNPPGLRFLDLSKNKLSDQNCSELLAAACRSGSIEALELGYSHIHKGYSFLHVLKKWGAPFLSGQCRLRHLGLSNNSLNGKFLCRFLDTIKDYKCISSVDLSGNDFTYTTHFKEKIRSFLRSNVSIRLLNLCDCKLSAESTKAIHLGLIENDHLLLLPMARNTSALHCNEFSMVQEKLASNRRLYQTHRGVFRFDGSEAANAGSRMGNPVDAVNTPSGMPPIFPASTSAFAPAPHPRDVSSETQISSISSESVVSPSDNESMDQNASVTLNSHASSLTFAPSESRVSTQFIENTLSNTSMSNIMRNTDTATLESVGPSSPGALLYHGGDGGTNSRFIAEFSGNVDGDLLEAPMKSKFKNELRVLFASPLAWRDRSGKYHAIPMLDYISERDHLIQVFKEVNRNVDLCFDFATTDKLRTALSFGCTALHFSGHGHPSCLNFEDGRSGLQLLTNESLKGLVQAGGLKLEFLFVSACHSKKTGEAFVDAGVKHVVCAKVEEKILDSAAIAFTRAFYLTLLSGDTVQHSFDIAKQALRASPYVPDSVLEGEKFVLLPECSTEACGEGSKMVPPGYHNVSIFDGKQLKQWPAVASQCSMSNRNLPTIAINTNMLTSSILTQPLPSAPPDFEGREVDMHKVIVTLFARRLVSVLGEDGVGKSALAAAVCNYLSDRCIFEDGIFYVPCKSVVSHEGFLAQLQKVLLHSSAKMHTRVKAFASTMSFFQPINASNGPIRHMPQGIDSDEMFLLEELIITSFGNLKCLLVLDCTNQLLRDNDAATDMKMFISRMFSKCKYVKVLMTSNDNLIGLQQLGGLIEYPVRLGPLSLRNSLRLFAKLTPVLPSAELKIEFVDSILHGRKAVTTKAPKASTGSISTTETGTGTGTSTGATAGSNGESVSVVITPLSGSGNTPSDSASKPISVTRSNNSGTVSDVGGGAGTTPPVVSAARRQVEATTATKVLALFGDGHPGIIVKMASEYDAAAIYRLRDECWRITADDDV